MSSTPIIMANGRSRSQVSVYDYPEHLNPFYEDENHKRLRFWKLGKKDGTGRRGSFSFGGLKEMWTFKSFRLKKKSSSLGINKTSESPPPLRRDQEDHNGYQHYGTYDPRMRSTISSGSNTLSFQRNVPYRSSLQDMRLTNYEKHDYNENDDDAGEFIRNNRYRSTIQTPYKNNSSNISQNRATIDDALYPRVPTRRYVYGGSLTPQPQPRSLQGKNEHYYSSEKNGSYSNDEMMIGISRGPSQQSVASSNPFEDEEEREIATGGGNLQTNRSPSKRPAKKKRRAPPPPVPVPKVIVEESGSNPTTPSSTTTTTSQINQNEIKNGNEIDERIEIANLTAEIENFVKTSSTATEEEEEITNENAQTNENTDKTDITLRESSTKELRYSKKEEENKIENSKENTSENLKENKKENVNCTKIIVEAEISTAPREERNQIKLNGEEEQKSELVTVTTEKVKIKRSVKEDSPPAMKTIVVTESVSSSSSDNVVEKSVKEEENLNEESENAVKHKENPTSAAVTSHEVISEVDAQLEQHEKTPPTIELKITESKEDLSEKSEYSEISERSGRSDDVSSINDITSINQNNSKDSCSSKFHIRYVPLKDSSPDEPPEPVLRNQRNASASPRLTRYTTPSGETRYDVEETNGVVTHGRRRSVKEIIESINRSQSLLKVNHEEQAPTPSRKYPYDPVVNNLNQMSVVKPPPRKKFTEDRETLNRSFKSLAESEREIKRLIKEMELTPGGGAAGAGAGYNDASSRIDNYYITNGVKDNNNIKDLNINENEIDSIIEKLTDELNNNNSENTNENNEIFKKCTVVKEINRESSPTASNLDWNPLPKPKRTKNLSPELTKSSSSSYKEYVDKRI